MIEASACGRKQVLQYTIITNQLSENAEWKLRISQQKSILSELHKELRL